MVGGCPRLSRRGLLRGSIGGVGTAVLAGLGVSVCGGSDADPVAEAPPVALPGPQLLGVAAVAQSLADSVSVPAGYTASVLCALGDPILPGTSAYQNDGTDSDFDQRGGDHHDGMEWFGLGADGQRSDSVTERGLLAINHEATTDETLPSRVTPALRLPAPPTLPSTPAWPPTPWAPPRWTAPSGTPSTPPTARSTSR